MYDAVKIIGGVIIFLLLLTSPIWYNLASGKADYLPDPEISTEETECVMPVEYMRAEHMDLLNLWRNEVVRENNRIHTAHNGREFNKSLTSTCLSCHPNKSEFCDKCHLFSAVDEPDCWNCHLIPEEVH